jgi:hypothetical protein
MLVVAVEAAAAAEVLEVALEEEATAVAMLEVAEEE